MKRQHVIVAAALILGVVRHADAQTFRVDSAKRNATAGLGFDVGTGLVVPRSCLKGSAVASTTPQQVVAFAHTINLHDSASALFQSTTAKASFRGGGIFWQASAAADYMKSVSSSTRSMYLEIEIAATFPGETYKTPNIYAAVGSAVLRNAAKFRNDCGTHYIDSTSRGGYFHVIARISTSESSDMTGIRTTLAGAIATQKFDAAFTQQFLQISSTHNVSISVVQTGGTLSSPRTLDDALTAAQTFVTNVGTAPPITEFTIATYPSPPLPTFPILSSYDDYNQQFIEASEARQELAAQIRLLSIPLSSKTEARVGTCDATKEVNAATRELDAMKAHLRKLDRTGKACSSKPSSCRSLSAPTRTFQFPPDCGVIGMKDFAQPSLVKRQDKPILVEYAGHVPFQRYDVRVTVDAQYLAHCPVSNAGNAPHQVLKYRIDGPQGGANFVVEPNGKQISKTFNWSASADMTGSVKLNFTLYNEIEAPPGVNVNCALDVKGTVRFEPQ